MEFDLSTLFIAWSSILLGSFITYYLVQRYEKIKDKIKIKEKLVDLANESWQLSSQYLGALAWKEQIELRKSYLVEYSKNIDYLEGLIMIYSDDSSLIEKFLSIKNDFGKYQKDFLKFIEENPNDNNGIREFYLKTHKENNQNFRHLFSVIKNLKIKYIV